MALSYTFTKYKDTYTITNNGLTDLTYVVKVLTCDSSKQTATSVILPDNTKNIMFLYDGRYEILLDDGTEQETINVNIYFDLLLSFIDSVETLVCGCKKCDGCEDVCNDCESFLATLVKALSFNSLNSSIYQAYTNSIAESVRCDFNDTVACAMLKNKVYGNVELEEIIIKLIGYYYFAFYFKDSILASDQNEKDYITAKYKYIKIAKCMKKEIGLTPTDVFEELEKDTIVYYWQLDNITDALDEVNTAITGLTYLNTKSNLSFINFQEGRNVNYTLVGRAVFAISPTQIQDFIIEDSLGNNITDEFDTSFNDDFKLAVFVSKNYYVPSTLYFKFKKDF